MSRLGKGGLNGAAIGDESVALATCSSDNTELDVDEGGLGFRRRGRGGTHVASSDPPDGEPETYPVGIFCNCLEGLRLRVRVLGVVLLTEELDEVVLRIWRTRSRSSCSSERFIDCACLLASSDCLMMGLITCAGLVGIKGGPEGVMRFAIEVIGIGTASEGRRGGAASNVGLRGGSGGSLPGLKPFAGDALLSTLSRLRNGF